MEEGEVNGQELCITSHSVARISFAKEPHVEQVSPHRSPLAGALATITHSGRGHGPSLRLKSAFLLDRACLPVLSHAHVGVCHHSDTWSLAGGRGPRVCRFSGTHILLRLCCPLLRDFSRVNCWVKGTF